MQKRLLGIVLSVVVVVALVAWFSWPEIAPSMPGIDSAPSRERANLATSETGAAEPAAAAASERRAAVEAAAAAVPAPPRRVFGNVTLDVLVVDGKTGAPKPDATVWFWDEATQQAVLDLPEDDPRLADGYIWSMLRAKFGRSLLTDAEGRVRITGVAWTEILAESAGWMGTAAVDEDLAARGGLLRIPLLPERRFDVRVRTAEGRPVEGAIVQVVGLDSLGQLVRTTSLRGSSTDRNGLARFDHLQQPCDELPPLVGDDPIAVVLDWPGCTDVMAAFVPNRLPTEPIELTLPPCGSIVVTVRDFEGGHDGVTLTEYGADDVRQRVVRLTSDRGLFEHVPIGVRYELRRWRFDERAVVDGPRAASELVHVQLTRPPNGVELIGVMCREDGTTIGDAEIQVDVELERAGRVERHEIELRTNADGSFLRRETRLVAADRLLSGFAVVAGSGPGDGVAKLSSRTLTSGRNDIGRLQLARPRVVVAGTVSVTGFAPDADPWCEVDAVVERCDAATGKWDQIGGVVPRRHGAAFEVVGEVDVAARLRVHFGPYLLLQSGPVEFAAGSTDLVLNASPCIDTLATAQFDAMVPPDLLAELEPLDLAPGIVRHLVSPGDPLRGDFELQGERAIFRWSVPAGTYRLVFRIAGFPAPLLVVPEIVVAAGKTDERATDVDLRGKLAWLELHVVDAAGNPMFAHVAALGAAVVASQDQTSIKPGQRRLVPAGPLDLFVYSSEFQPLELFGVRGRVRVTVQPWRSTEIVLQGLPPIPAGVEWQLGASALPPQPVDWSRLASYRQCWGAAATVVDGRARLAFGEGPVQLRLWLRRLADGRMVEVPGIEPVVVAASDQALVVRVPTATATDVGSTLLTAPR